MMEFDDNMPTNDNPILKDEEIRMLKDKVAHLKNQLEESENDTFKAAELGQQLLEEKSSLEAIREEERINYTSKLEELIQENYNLTNKLESKERLLASHYQESDENNKKKLELEKEQLVASYEGKISDLKSDLKKEKLRNDEEISQLNLKVQQNEKIVENLQQTIADLRRKNKAAESKNNDVGEISELKNALENCFEKKLSVEEKLNEMIHDNERKSLEISNLRECLKELNEELIEKKRQKDDCYQHLEEAKETIAELSLTISQLEMELKCSGHSKRGNSLFGELEDKRVAAERKLAIFRAKYESLQKAYAIAKNDNLKMKNQVLCFLQTRADKADRLRIEHLEQALSSKRSEFTVLAAKLRVLEEKEDAKAKYQINKVKELMGTFAEPEATKDHISLLLLNIEEYKKEIESLRNEQGKIRFSLIATNDKLQETQRKLYTSTNAAEKFRNESLRAKIKLETEKGKRVELETFLEKLGVIDRSSVSEKNWAEIMKERQVVLPKYMQMAAAKKEKEKVKPKTLEADLKCEAATATAIKEEKEEVWLDMDCKSSALVADPNEKYVQLLRKTLPKELAEKYIQKYKKGQSEEVNDDKENDDVMKKGRKTANLKNKSRKVSFKDEVEEFDEDCDEAKIDSSLSQLPSNTSQQVPDSTLDSKMQESKKVVAADYDQEELCKVQ